jgi:GxxExxY protein
MNPDADLLPDRELTSDIINAAIAVHRELGPGFIESIYEAALCVELAARGVPFERQKTVPVLYHGRAVGEHRLDLLVAGRVVVELKAIHALERIHYSIVRSYMKATSTSVGLLLNFAAMPLAVKRVGREFSQDPIPS